MPAHLSAVPLRADHIHDTDGLVGLAHLLADPALAPSMCGVVRHDRTFELHLRPLEGSDPVRELLGFEAPGSWAALGLAVSGRARRIDSPRGSGGSGPDHVVVGLVLDRCGVLRSVLRRAGAPPVVVEDHECGEPQGFLVDACRRALGLATAPPDQPVEALFAATWLDLVVQTAVADPARPPTRDELTRLHPALGALDEPGRAVQDLRPRATWESLRADVAGDPLAEQAYGLPVGVASWMDGGMFSRWLLARTPELAELRAAVGELLPTRTAEWVADVLGHDALDRGPGTTARGGRPPGRP